jgi:hypothetical protein
MSWRHDMPQAALRARFRPRRAPVPCPATRKLGYLTRAAAKRALDSCRGRARLERRVYRCPHCRQWHLTHWGRT